MKLKIINVGDRTNKYVGSFAPTEIEIIKKYAKGNILNLFSGSSTIGNVRIDFNHKNATINQDVFEYIKFLKASQNYNVDTLIIDPPYSEKFAKKYSTIYSASENQFIIFANSRKTSELFNWIIHDLKPKRIILKSWNYYILQKYKLVSGFLCYPGGYRKSTILLIMDRIPYVSPFSDNFVSAEESAYKNITENNFASQEGVS